MIYLYTTDSNDYLLIDNLLHNYVKTVKDP